MKKNVGSIVIDEKYDKCCKMLKDSISSKRYNHSLGVSNTAACLAMSTGIDVYPAYLAGLLHDCAKGLSGDELIETVKKAGIEISDTEKKSPELLHAKAGSVLAKTVYKITDEDILSAIYWHTTGKPCMTTLEEIVFVADYIEPNRTGLPELAIIRKKAFSDLASAITLICENTLAHLEMIGASVDETTLETYEYYRRH